MEESDGGVGGASVQPIVLTPPTFATPTCTDEHLLEEQRNRESRPAYREMMVRYRSNSNRDDRLVFLGISGVPSLLVDERRHC